MHQQFSAARSIAAALFLTAAFASGASAQESALTRVERTTLTMTASGADYQTEQMFVPALGGGQTQAFAGGGTALRWSIDSGGSWIADAMSLGNDGTEAIVEYGDFNNTVEAHSAHSSDALNPLIQSGSSVLNANRTVVSAASSSAHISAHLEFDSTTYLWVPVLRMFSLGSTAPDWTYVSDLGAFSTDTLNVDLSADGTRAVLLEFDFASISTRISVFDTTSSTPVLQFSVMTFSGVRDMDLSSDGSTLVMASNQRLTICDVATGSIFHNEFLATTPNYRAVALADDGQVMVYAGLGDLRVMTRDSAVSYATVHEETLGNNTYARRVAVSGDGSTVVAGIHQFDAPNAVRLLALSTSNFAPLLDLSLSGSGALTNLVEQIACSRDGSLLAVGMWGDEDGMLPELMVYRTDNAQLVLAENLDGSVKAMTLAPNGSHVAVASKGIHEMVWGGGGSLRLYRVGQPDIELGGAPLANTSVILSQSLRQGHQGRILVSTQLAAVPTAAPQYGSGLLYLDSSSLVELPLLTGDASNSTTQAFPLGAAGTELFFQAVNAQTAQLGKGWLKVTVAP